MSKRLATGTASERGRKVFIHPGDSSLRQVSYGRIRLDSENSRQGDAVLLPEGSPPNVAIPGSTPNFVWIMAAHREVVDRKWGVVQVGPRFA